MKPKHGSRIPGINSHAPFLPQVEPKRQARRCDNGNGNQYIFLLHAHLAFVNIDA
jgi:hypothetical protein